MTGRFISRQLEIPPDEDDPAGSATTSARPASGQSNRSTGASPFSSIGESAANGAPPLPALPSSLLEALDREPPSSTQNGAEGSPRSSLSYNRRPSPSASPQASGVPTPTLPSIGPHSPLGFSYSSSTPVGPSSLSMSERSPSQTSSHHDSTGEYDRRFSAGMVRAEASFAGGFSQPGTGEYSTSSSSSNVPAPTSQPRRSMWKSFGRQQRSSDSSNPSLAPAPSSSSSRAAPTFPTTTADPLVTSSLAPSHPVVGRRPSSGRISGTPSTPSDWLYQAQAATSAAAATASRRGSAATTSSSLGLREHVEGDSVEGGSRRESVRSLRNHAGRGVDAELDAMDSDPRLAPRRGSGRPSAGYLPGGAEDDEDDEEGLGGDEEEALPWTGGGQYTHNLQQGTLSDSDVEEETGTEIEETEEEEGSIAEASQGHASNASEQPPPPPITQPDRRKPDLQLAPAISSPFSPSESMSPTTPSLVTPPSSASGSVGGHASYHGRRESEASVASRSSRLSELEEGVRSLPMGRTISNQSMGRSTSNQSRKLSNASRISTADFTVAVVGPRHVGKSTVIRRGLKRPANKPQVIAEDEKGNRVTSSTSHFTISGQIRSIEVLEIDHGFLRYNAEGVIWPEGVPQCEGAMLCYDSTDPNALDSLSLLLQAFWTRGSDIPLIVLACKADPEAYANATDPNKAAAVCNIYGAGIVALDGGVDDPKKKMKESFNWVIRQIMTNRGEPRRPASAASSSPAESRRGSILPSDPHSTVPHPSSSAGVRPSSTHASGAPVFDNPFGDVTIPSYHGPSSSNGDSPTRTRGSRGGSLGLGLSIVQEAPVGSGEEEQQPLVQESADGRMMDQSRTSSVSGPPPTLSAQRDPMGPSPTAPTSRRESNATTATRDTARTSMSLDSRAALERKASHSKSSALDLYFAREDMIDKFLFASVTGNDEQYVTLFLIVYRRFARPFDVLTKLIERFDFVSDENKTDPLLSRFAQMKLCGVLSTWLQAYPGDFTAPATFSILQPFLTGLLPRGFTWVAHYAIELVPLLSALPQLHDPEASWALPDRPLEDGATRISASLPSEARRPSLAPSYDSVASNSPSQPESSVDDNSVKLSVPSINTESSSTPPTTTVSPREGRVRTDSDAATEDTADSSDPAKSIQSSSSSSWKRSVPSASTLLDLSNALIEIPEDVIAIQITRIAWEAFIDMTPRHLMRHVLAPRDPKNPRTALRDAKSNVMQSINFVNYLAEWVATLILAQSKLKWRARILEKFITIAYSLRELENFDSLMGVLAGLNSQPVFRLAETMETVNLKLEGDRTKIPKRLRSLNKLMAATKSFSAYRLALANSGPNMLPYLGVHLQDITVVNEIKSDMRDGKVNWSKFSQMGRSAAIVLDCSRLAPTLPIDRDVERCILNVPVIDKDTQYSLSYTYQPRASSAKPVSNARRRFKNLADRSPFF